MHSLARRGFHAELVVAAATLAVLVAGLVLPGGGLVVALALSRTVLKEHSTARKFLIGLGALLLLLSLGVYSPPWTHPVSHTGTPTPAQHLVTP